MLKCFILFGIDDNIKTENVFDFILLLAKQYLYKCKIEKQLPNIDIFRRKKLLYRYKIQECNAKMSCSCTSFSSRWEPYKLLFFFFFLFLQANAVICLSFSCLFIHSMFMTYERLTVPLMKC